MSTLPHRRARCAWIDRIPAALAGLCLPVLVWWAGCMTERIRPPGGRTPVVMTMEVTGYCNCGICCSWERSWFGLGSPVISRGLNKGKPIIPGEGREGDLIDLFSYAAGDVL